MFHRAFWLAICIALHEIVVFFVYLKYNVISQKNRTLTKVQFKLSSASKVYCKSAAWQETS